MSTILHFCLRLFALCNSVRKKKSNDNKTPNKYSVDRTWPAANCQWLKIFSFGEKCNALQDIFYSLGRIN